MNELVWQRGVTMRTPDRETLVADLWHPAVGGPFPTLVVRTAYGREVASAITAPHPSVFARAGYLVVSQDVRGRGDSSGAFDPFTHEATDGAATVAWAAELAESNGNVGMYGFSYQGAAQLLAASTQPRALRAIAPAMCSADPDDGFLRTGGAFRLGFAASWAAQLAGVDGFLGDLAATRLAEHCASGRVDAWPLWDRWRAGDCGPQVDVTRLDLPALFTIGWFDTFAAAGWRDVQRYDASDESLGITREISTCCIPIFWCWHKSLGYTPSFRRMNLPSRLALTPDSASRCHAQRPARRAANPRRRFWVKDR